MNIPNRLVKHYHIGRSSGQPPEDFCCGCGKVMTFQDIMYYFLRLGPFCKVCVTIAGLKPVEPQMWHNWLYGHVTIRSMEVIRDRARPEP